MFSLTEILEFLVSRKQRGFGLKVGESGKLARMIERSQFFFVDETPRPLGRLTLAGTNKDSGGVGRNTLRVYGRFAVVLLVSGSGEFRDARGFKSDVVAGDCLLVFPEVGHAYGPKSGTHWSEIYLCFDGPIFELWRREALLDVARPIHHVASWREVFQRLESFVDEARPGSIDEHLAQLNRFLAILGELVSLPVVGDDSPRWLESAKARLRGGLGETLQPANVAREVGMSYESFRKQFQRETGVSPARFRDLARIEAAQTLLESGALKNAAIARGLGFRDEAHFARRFRELMGISPRAWKNQRKQNKTDAI
jgi:AraC-like DNA-binding protein